MTMFSVSKTEAKVYQGIFLVGVVAVILVVVVGIPALCIWAYNHISIH